MIEIGKLNIPTELLRKRNFKEIGSFKQLVKRAAQHATDQKKRHQ
jgi:hypothetical protein